MKKLILKSVLMTVLILSVASCRKDEPANPNNGQPNEVAVGTLDLGSTINADFQGRVVDENGDPVSNVLITAGTKTTTTDDQGMFVIKNASVHEKLAYIKAQKTGYFPGSRSVIPSETSSSYIKIEMIALNIAGTISSGTEATVTTNGGASIDFSGQYVDNSGNPYSGNVTVAAKYLPPLAPSTVDQMPGMLYAENENGDAGVLVTYGMMVVELFGSDGQPLNLAQGTTATLHMPLDDAQAGSAPATIPLWFFDEVAGYWVEEGSATLIEGEYVGTVEHFTFWNCDVFYEACEHYGLITDDLGNPIGNAAAYFDLGWIATTCYSNTDGTFHTYLAANQTMDVDVSYGCGGSVNSYTVGPYAVNSVNYETYVVDLSVGMVTVTGTLVNCDAQPVTNADIYFFDGMDFFTYHVSDGNINITIPSCITGTSPYLYIYDYDQPYAAYSGTPLTFTYPTMDVGQVTICDSIYPYGGGGFVPGDCTNEYMLFMIDGVTVVEDSCVEYTPIYDSLSMATSFYICSAGETNYMVIGTDITNVGTYPGTVYSWPSLPGEILFVDYYTMDLSSPVNYTTDVITYTGPGGILELSLTGTYVDIMMVSHTVDVYLMMNIPN